MKKKILLDLDIITVAEWKGKDVKIARNFIERVKSGEFEVYTPYLLLDLVSKWKNKKLAEKILHFFELYSTKIFTAEEILKQVENLGIDDRKIINSLISEGIKEEDSAMIVIVSVFDLDYLVTMNRMHLKDKNEKINEVLMKNGIRGIKIVLPNEL